MTDPLVMASRIGGAVTGPVLRFVARRTLGEPQRRALEAAIRGSAEAAGSRHPAIADISGDIDLVADEAVADELMRYATGQGTADWTAAKTRWSTLYGTVASEALAAFLADVADELANRMRTNPELQSLYLVERSDVIIDTQGSIQRHIEAIATRIDAQIDPIRATRYEGERVGSDISYLSDLLGQVGAEFREGPLAAAVGLEVALGQSGSRVRLNPNPGSDVQVSLRFTATDDEAGRERLDSLRSAMENGTPINADGAEVELVVDGQQVFAAGQVRVSSAPMPVAQTAVIEFRGAAGPPSGSWCLLSSFGHLTAPLPPPRQCAHHHS